MRKFTFKHCLTKEVIKVKMVRSEGFIRACQKCILNSPDEDNVPCSRWKSQGKCGYDTCDLLEDEFEGSVWFEKIN